MKRLFKILVAASFLVALCLNVSINASKGANDTGSFGIISEANAACEADMSTIWNTGKCDFMGHQCWFYVEYALGGGDCHVSGSGE